MSSKSDATELAARVHGRELEPLDVIDAAVAACERLNPTLNAVFSTRFEVAPGARSSPRAGRVSPPRAC